MTQKKTNKKTNSTVYHKTTVKDHSRRKIAHQHEIYSSGANEQALQSFSASHQTALSIYHQLGSIIKQNYGGKLYTNVKCMGGDSWETCNYEQVLLFTLYTF